MVNKANFPQDSTHVPKKIVKQSKRGINDGKQLQQKVQHSQPVAWLEVIVHWTRSDRQKYSAIKLQPPW